jgi:hypothetical protein
VCLGAIHTPRLWCPPRSTGVRLAANTERTGALKTGTAHLHARAPVVSPAQLMDSMTTCQRGSGLEEVDQVLRKSSRSWLIVSASVVGMSSRVEMSRADEVELATAEWIAWFNHRRLSQYCADITPIEMAITYYAQTQGSPR